MASISSISMVGASVARAQVLIPPSVEFSVPKAPSVAVTDSGAALVYELHVTNLSSTSMTLRRVEVLDAPKAGGVIADLSGAALERVLARAGPPARGADRAKIGAGLRDYVYMWIPVDAAHPPAALHHRLTFQLADTGATVQLEGTVTPVTPSVAVIAPPIHGEWVAINGPSNVSGHRRLVMGLDGRTAIGQRFAIDFLKVDSTAQSYRGERLDNASYYAYGTELHAVADGVVAFVKDGIPQNVPGSRAVPITMETVGGNHVALDIGHGRYALYAHVQPGSIRVKPGDHVKQGQVIALLGNSGNSTEPHVHFQIADGPTFLSSEGLPYAMDFDVIGRCDFTTGPAPALACTRQAPVHVTHGIPMQNEMIRLP